MSTPGPNMDARQRIRQAVPWVEEQRGRVRPAAPPVESVEPVFVRVTDEVSTTLVPRASISDPYYYSYPGKVTYWSAATLSWADRDSDIAILPANGERLIEGVRYDARFTGYTTASGTPVFVTVPGPPIIWARLKAGGIHYDSGEGYDGGNGVFYEWEEMYFDTTDFVWKLLAGGRSGTTGGQYAFEVRNRESLYSDPMDVDSGDGGAGYAVVQLTRDALGTYIFKAPTVMVTADADAGYTTTHRTAIQFDNEFYVTGGGESVTVNGAGITGSYP